MYSALSSAAYTLYCVSSPRSNKHLSQLSITPGSRYLVLESDSTRDASRTVSTLSSCVPYSLSRRSTTPTSLPAKFTSQKIRPPSVPNFGPKTVREVRALAGFGHLPDFQSVSRKILTVGPSKEKFEARGWCDGCASSVVTIKSVRDSEHCILLLHPRGRFLRQFLVQILPSRLLLHRQVMHVSPPYVIVI